MPTLNDFEVILQKLQEKGEEVEFFGPVSESEIKQAEQHLGLSFPSVFKDFLRKWGGGGIVAGSQISGLMPGNPLMNSVGTLIGDTTQARSRFEIDHRYLVIHTEDEETYWCLDCEDRTSNDAPVYSIDVFHGNKAKQITESFPALLVDYFGSWLES